MPEAPSPDPKETFTRFEKLLADLARAKVDFALAGGLAVVLNGYPRMTVDADILVHDSPDNLRNLLNSLAGWGEGWARELTVADFGPAPCKCHSSLLTLWISSGVRRPQQV